MVNLFHDVVCLDSKLTCGLMFPRYRFVVEGSPTSWEPGALSSKTAQTEKRESCPTAC